MLQTSSNLITRPPPAPTPPAFPPPLAAAPTSRRSYQREASASPAPPLSSSRGGRRFSHSRGRPLAVGARSSLSRERSNSLGGSSSAEWKEEERTRSESRAPLWRRGKESGGAAKGGGSPGKGKRRSKRHPLSRLPPILAHFLGYRPIDHKITSPIFPGLSYLPFKAETLLLTFIGTLVSILIACAVSNALSQSFASLPLAIGSLGATAVLLFAAPEGPLSQPRHLIGGHMISALVGVCMSYLFSLSPRFVPSENADGNNFQHLVPVAAALAVSISVLLMQVTKTVHPPGGATALIAAFRPDFSFVLLVFVSITTMGLWACIIGNLGRRRYPVYWFSPDEDVQGGPQAPVGDDDEGGLDAVGEEEEDVDADAEMGERERGRRAHRYA